MNAVEHMARMLAPEAVRRLAALRASRFAQWTAMRASTDEARACVIDRWADDLCGFLNALTRGELAELAQALRVDDRGRSIDLRGVSAPLRGPAKPVLASDLGGVSAPLRGPAKPVLASELRARLWDAGAALERGDADVGALQPRPIILGGHLVVQAPPRGLYPPSARWPRALPAAADAAPPTEEPETLDELLAAADRLVGVRLGARGRDKGAWGLRAAALLGIVERGHEEPDWRGDVEVKTVPVALDGSGFWRIAEDPAIAMVDGNALSKLQRTLWLVRADADDHDATILSWYLLDADADVARLVRRYLHDRPKGPRGTDQRGLYLHKRFFADAGLLATLNGLP